MCHMSGVICQVSGIRCQVSDFFLLLLFFKEVFVEGMLSTGPTPCSLDSRIGSEVITRCKVVCHKCVDFA